jgi:hypothetical protein
MISRISAAIAIVALSTMPLRAQEVEAPPDQNLPPPVSLTYVDGEVQSLNQGAADRADVPSMLVDGDGIRTGRGRAELVFGDGSVVHVDENTAVDLLGDHRLRVRGGRVVFRASPAADPGYVIDTPAASIRVESRGEYNLFVDDGRRALNLGVGRGVAEIELSSERLVVRSGEEARLDGPGARPVVRAFNSARLDAFDRWSLTRYEGEELSASSRRLPVELRAYGDTFDRYGRWETVAPYGQVWYPSVAGDWRPYYNGGWRQTRYGMTWYGNDPWAWPTHHYGRWQYGNNFWFWVPARTWGPAWVSWAYAPGYVSWAPLGWNSRPVVPFYLQVGVVNPNRWHAWTVMPRSYLGYRGSIRPWVVDGRRLPGPTSTAFVQQPIRASQAYAVRRGSSNPQSPSPYDRAVPRGSYTDRGGVVHSGPAAAPSARPNDGAVKRDPYTPAPRGVPYTPYGRGTAQPRATGRQAPDDQAQPQSTQPQSPQPGAIRRGDSPSYAPSNRGEGQQSRPRDEARPTSGEGQRSGSAREETRSPRYQRPESSTGASSAPRAEGARPRGDSGRSNGGSEGRARGGQSGGGKGSEGSSGTRSGSARKPPGN